MMELRIQLIPTGEIILPPGKNGENYCNNCKVSSHTVTRARWGSASFFTLASGLQTDADTAEVTGFISHRAEAEEHSHTLVIRSHGRQIELNWGQLWVVPFQILSNLKQFRAKFSSLVFLFKQQSAYIQSVNSLEIIRVLHCFSLPLLFYKICDTVLEFNPFWCHKGHKCHYQCYMSDE